MTNTSFEEFKVVVMAEVGKREAMSENEYPHSHLTLSSGGEDLVKDGKFNVMFRKGMIDNELLKYNSVKELVEYVDNKDADIEKVKILIRRVNRDLKKLPGKKLYVRKARSHDKYAENRICMTSR
jgi:hypothetical protein